MASPLSAAVDVCSAADPAIDLDVATQTLAQSGWRILGGSNRELHEGNFIQYYAARSYLSYAPSRNLEDINDIAQLVFSAEMRDQVVPTHFDPLFTAPGDEFLSKRLMISSDGSTQLELINEGYIHCVVFGSDVPEFRNAAAELTAPGGDGFHPDLAESFRSQSRQDTGGIGWVAVLNTQRLSALTNSPFTTKFVFRIYSGR